MNLRDITTQSDLEDKNAVFAFDIHPKLSPILALGYSAEIQWTVLKEEFGVSQRLQFFYVPPEVKNCRPLSNTTLEPVGTGSYNLTVDVAKIGAGPLSISVSVHFACLDSSSYRRCYYCSQWRYTSQMSSKIDISAKRGRATHCSICTRCMYLHVCIALNYNVIINYYLIFHFLCISE